MLADVGECTAWADTYFHSVGPLSCFLRDPSNADSLEAADLRLVEGPRGCFVRVPGAAPANAMTLLEHVTAGEASAAAAVMASMFAFGDNMRAVSSINNVLQGAVLVEGTLQDSDVTDDDDAEVAVAAAGSDEVPTSKSANFLLRLLHHIPASLRGAIGSSCILPLLIDELSLTDQQIEKFLSEVERQHASQLGRTGATTAGCHSRAGMIAALGHSIATSPDDGSTAAVSKRKRSTALLNQLMMQQRLRSAAASEAALTSSGARVSGTQRTNAAATSIVPDAADRGAMPVGDVSDPASSTSQGLLPQLTAAGDTGAVPALPDGSQSVLAQSSLQTEHAAAVAAPPRAETSVDASAEPPMGSEERPASLAAAKAVVERMRREWLDVGSHSDGHPSTITRDVAVKATQRLAADLYKDASHFLFEMLQNADDNTYASAGGDAFAAGNDAVPQICLVCDHSDAAAPSLTVTNNEAGFRVVDIEALCQTGGSTKTMAGYIGKKGIGWKSVFAVSRAPEVHSGYAHFSFNCRPVAAGGLGPVGQLAPTWLEPPSDTRCTGSGAECPRDFTQGTVFKLPLDPPAPRSSRTGDELLSPAKLEDALVRLTSTPSILLFMRRLRLLSATVVRRLPFGAGGNRDGTERITRTLHRLPDQPVPLDINATADGHRAYIATVVSTTEGAAGTESITHRWLVYSRPYRCHKHRRELCQLRRQRKPRTSSWPCLLRHNLLMIQLRHLLLARVICSQLKQPAMHRHHQPRRSWCTPFCPSMTTACPFSCKRTGSFHPHGKASRATTPGTNGWRMMCFQMHFWGSRTCWLATSS